MSQFTYSTTASDLWGSSSDGVVNTDDRHYLGTNGGGGSFVKNWIPFTINLPKGLIITTATLKVIAVATRSDYVDLDIGCEAADNPSAPADWTALNARTLSTAFTNWVVPAFTSGNEYTVDITTAVQEILNRAGWASGNTMAILAKNNATVAGAFRRFAASEHATSTEPILVIDFPSHIPRGGFII